MKSIFRSLIPALFFLGIALLTGCERDNRPEPKSILTGRVVYDGQPVGVRSNGVQLELWQHGYQLFTKIPVHINQDGEFSAALFDGNYKLVRLRGNGPWVDNTDSINVAVRGNMQVDVPVEPYFVFQNDSYSREEEQVSATFQLKHVNTTRDLERVNLYVGTTTIIDPNNNSGNAQLMAANVDLSRPITLSATLAPALSGRDYVYVRLGVKTMGVGEMLFGKPQKIMLK